MTTRYRWILVGGNPGEERVTALNTAKNPEQVTVPNTWQEFTDAELRSKYGEPRWEQILDSWLKDYQRIVQEFVGGLWCDASYRSLSPTVVAYRTNLAALRYQANVLRKRIAGEEDAAKAQVTIAKAALETAERRLRDADQALKETRRQAQVSARAAGELEDKARDAERDLNRRRHAEARLSVVDIREPSPAEAHDAALAKGETPPAIPRKYVNRV